MVRGLGRVLGFGVLGFGFRGLGIWGLGFWGIGFRDYLGFSVSNIRACKDLKAAP